MGRDEEAISRLALEIFRATQAFSAGECLEEELPTAAELARKLNYRLEYVKKRLKPLKEADLIQAISHQPKRYRFNNQALRSLNEDDSLYALLYGHVFSELS